jgi:hypothetical protein
MIITVQFDTSLADDAAAIGRLFGATAAAATADVDKPAKKPKPVVPVAGNPDKIDAVVAAVQAPAPAVVETKPTAVTLRADAPAEIVKLLASDPVVKEVLSDAVLKACKPVADGGLTRPVTIAILEKFRPVGNTEPLLRMRDIKPESYAAIRTHILDGYKA